MKLRTFALLAALPIATQTASAANEYALLRWSNPSFTWTDSAGEHRVPDRTNNPFFHELSGESNSPASESQAEIVLLNGLSKKGWQVVSVNQTEEATSFLFCRTASDVSARAGANSPGNNSASQADATHVPITFSEGHDLDPHDRGRPVVLVASALKVPPEVFREAFSHVTPAPSGTSPDPDQVRRNKEALLSRLSPFGVTNERLDEVSNYYRYERDRDGLWQTRPAAAYAIVKAGKVQAIIITDGGAGYSSTPTATLIQMPQLRLNVELNFGEDLKTNGSIKSLDVAQ